MRSTSFAAKVVVQTAGEVKREREEAGERADFARTERGSEGDSGERGRE